MTSATDVTTTTTLVSRPQDFRNRQRSNQGSDCHGDTKADVLAQNFWMWWESAAETVWRHLINILNVDLNGDQWLQASLPVGDGGLEIRSAEMLASSFSFLASAASTLRLQQSILPDSIWLLGDQSVEASESLWRDLANSSKPAQDTQHIQQTWYGPVAANHRYLILSRAQCDVDKARLLALSQSNCCCSWTETVRRGYQGSSGTQVRLQNLWTIHVRL